MKCDCILDCPEQADSGCLGMCRWCYEEYTGTSDRRHDGCCPNGACSPLPEPTTKDVPMKTVADLRYALADYPDDYPVLQLPADGRGWTVMVEGLSAERERGHSDTETHCSELDHVLWFCRLLEERGYDLHSLAHLLEPLTGEEYDRRYVPKESTTLVKEWGESLKDGDSVKATFTVSSAAPGTPVRVTAVEATAQEFSRYIARHNKEPEGCGKKIRNEPCAAEPCCRGTAKVTLFKLSGKYYTHEEWRIPDNAIQPHEMERSPDFHRVSGGPVLVHAQEPWGYPVLLVASSDGKREDGGF